MRALAQAAKNPGDTAQLRTAGSAGRYERELLEWNARFNLTAIQEPEKIRTKHFLDSLTCLGAMRSTGPWSG